MRLWTRERGSRNQTSYSDSIHGRVCPSGILPLYFKLNVSHAMSPSVVASIVEYKSVWFAKGGLSPYGVSVAPQRLNKKLMSPADIWVCLNRKFVVSNWVRLSYGVQSLGSRLVSLGGGGTPGGISSPFSSHGVPIKDTIL